MLTNVLIIEDDKDQQQLLKKKLNSSTLFMFDTDVVGCLAEAKQVLDNKKIDVILLDLNLPDSEGVDTILWVTSNYPNFPVVIISVIDDLKTESLAIKSGVQDYLIKGKARIEDLEHVIHNSIERFQSFKRVKQKYDDLSKTIESIQKGEVDTIISNYLPSGCLKVEDMKLARENQKLLHRLEEMANHDVLTGLANRRFFENIIKAEIGRSLRSDLKFSLLFIDLDKFKLVNDHHGHDYGDTLLQQVANRLKKCLRNSDSASRYGGDEFGVLLPELYKVEEVSRVCIKILDALANPFEIKESKIEIGASIGVAIYPDGGTELQSLIRSADIALYRVKESTRNDYQFYREDLNVAYQRRLKIESGLKKALSQQEIYLCYQPVIHLRSRIFGGVEVLMRWQSKELGRVPPAEFIGIAESCGVLDDLTRYLLKTVCRQASCWFLSERGPFLISINISVRQFSRYDWAAEILNSLEKYNLPYQFLFVEITESAIMEQDNGCVHQLTRLYENGVKVAIDDFGTGYSSLSRLASLPVSLLKIDMSLVKGALKSHVDAQILKSTISMAHALNIVTVAEGIETEALTHFLTAIGCMKGQGFYFFKPLLASEITAYLDSDEMKTNGNQQQSMHQLIVHVRKQGHDLNNAIAGVSGYCEVLQKKDICKEDLLDEVIENSKFIFEKVEMLSFFLRKEIANEKSVSPINEVIEQTNQIYDEINLALKEVAKTLSVISNLPKLEKMNSHIIIRMDELMSRAFHIIDSIRKIDASTLSI